jgi:3-hydroxyisobutyrate dehydrogenase
MSGRPFRLGFIGLGIMGTPMAQRLLRRGWQVTVWNLEPERFAMVEPLGARWAESPAAVRAASDVVAICVLGDAAIENVCLGPNGLASGTGATRVIDFSTTAPEVTLSIAGRLGMDWLDCPMSGGPQAAADGQLTMMAGGDAALFAALEPILADLGANITLMGGPAAGQRTKIINQAIVGVNYVLMGEILAMVRAGGIDGSKLAACLEGGAADSRILQTIFPQMLAADFADPRGHAKQLNKDMQSVEHFIAGHSLDLPLQAVAVRQFETYVSAGNGEADSASICRLYLGDHER